MQTIYLGKHRFSVDGTTYVRASKYRWRDGKILRCFTQTSSGAEYEEVTNCGSRGGRKAKHAGRTYLAIGEPDARGLVKVYVAAKG